MATKKKSTKPKRRSKAKGIVFCESCGSDTTEYGVSTCPECNETKCVEICIPAGVGTLCIECEENAGDEEIENDDE